MQTSKYENIKCTRYEYWYNLRKLDGIYGKNLVLGWNGQSKIETSLFDEAYAHATLVGDNKTAQAALTWLSKEISILLTNYRKS
jgi:hypothetical protein